MQPQEYLGLGVAAVAVFAPLIKAPPYIAWGGVAFGLTLFACGMIPDAFRPNAIQGIFYAIGAALIVGTAIQQFTVSKASAKPPQAAAALLGTPTAPPAPLADPSPTPTHHPPAEHRARHPHATATTEPSSPSGGGPIGIKMTGGTLTTSGELTAKGFNKALDLDHTDAHLGGKVSLEAAPDTKGRTSLYIGHMIIGGPAAKPATAPDKPDETH